MPKRRYERREPTHEWQQIRPLLKDTVQINYEIIRPVVLWGETPKERGAETGVSPRTIYYRANRFDEAGMASLLPKAGYVHFRNFLLYGERNLARETVLVDIFQDVLTLDYHQERLSRYSVEWQPDDRHLARVGYPRLYQHRYQSPQLELWQPSEVEWFVIIRDSPPVRRRKRTDRIFVIQPPLLSDGTQGLSV